MELITEEIIDAAKNILDKRVTPILGSELSRLIADVATVMPYEATFIIKSQKKVVIPKP